MTFVIKFEVKYYYNDTYFYRFSLFIVFNRKAELNTDAFIFLLIFR